MKNHRLLVSPTDVQQFVHVFIFSKIIDQLFIHSLLNYQINFLRFRNSDSDNDF